MAQARSRTARRVPSLLPNSLLSSAVDAINILGVRFLSHRDVGCRRAFHEFVREVFDRCVRLGHEQAHGAALLHALLLAGAADPAPEVSEAALEWLNGEPPSGHRRLAGETLSARLLALHEFAEAAAAAPLSAADPTAAVTRRAMAAAEERWAAVACTLLLAVPEGNQGQFNRLLHDSVSGIRRAREHHTAPTTLRID